ncbi:chemotaxis protein CheW [Massilia agilis]|uniref:Chemotaxis protein CheW n=1 Tax=Massilia agilis TaxID=1811226 RepID=A0ABT2DBD1_9BURK|nr:chemotaxis protein CheW [Massilia agilis]MCS0808448.1 chemotaxis protein CheW [Massilia agilis]
MNGTAYPEHGCWNRVGVAGDRSCAELARHAHCRNCPAYAEAAQRTMQRPVEPSYRAFWAEQLRQPPAQAQTGDASAIVLRIGHEWLALPSAMVLSVAPLAPAHRIPHRSAAGLLGVTNVGGRLLPALSLAPLLGIDGAAAPEICGRHVFARLLIVDANGQACAVPVDELHGMVRYARAQLAAPAATVERPRPAHLDGVLAYDGLQVGVLNGEQVAARLWELLK